MKRWVAVALLALSRACASLGGRAMARARQLGGWSHDETLRRFLREDASQDAKTGQSAPKRTKAAPADDQSPDSYTVDAPELGPNEGLFFTNPKDGRTHPLGQGPWN